jgi:hypothetical protein
MEKTVPFPFERQYRANLMFNATKSLHSGAILAANVALTDATLALAFIRMVRCKIANYDSSSKRLVNGILKTLF